ncbi:MAG: cystathionine beta-lyase MetC, partial [Porphyrobacter sp. HL-46]
FESLALPITPQDYRVVMPSPDIAGPAIRLSIGLEDAGDLIADLAQALAHTGNAR